jgi:ADP-ribose pyrophosphatase YjhB (NUDIX family)
VHNPCGLLCRQLACIRGGASVQQGLSAAFEFAAHHWHRGAADKRYSLERMISFDLGSHKFQVRAAAIFLWQGSVLLHRLEGDDFWALPGGRVEPGEDAAKTVVREMQEELGQDVACGPLTYVVENFFEDRGKKNHEIGFYFQASFTATSKILDATQSHIGIEGNRRLEFRWFELASLATVVLHPSFLRQSLREPTPHFKHIVQQG